MTCRCTRTHLCAACERRIDAAEDARDYPASDYRGDWLDNTFEKAMYPRQWN